MPEHKYDKIPAWVWKIYVGMIILFLSVGFLFLFGFFGGKKEAGEQERAKAQEVLVGPPAAPSMESIKEIARIPLLGEGVPSERALLLPGAIPPLWYYYFDGPSTAQVLYDDENPVSITKWNGSKGGTLKFSGPKGQEVIVRAYPPSK